MIYIYIFIHKELALNSQQLRSPHLVLMVSARVPPENGSPFSETSGMIPDSILGKGQSKPHPQTEEANLQWKNVPVLDGKEDWTRAHPSATHHEESRLCSSVWILCLPAVGYWLSDAASGIWTVPWGVACASAIPNHGWRRDSTPRTQMTFFFGRGGWPSVLWVKFSKIWMVLARGICRSQLPQLPGKPPKLRLFAGFFNKHMKNYPTLTFTWEPGGHPLIKQLFSIGWFGSSLPMGKLADFFAPEKNVRKLRNGPNLREPGYGRKYRKVNLNMGTIPFFLLVVEPPIWKNMIVKLDHFP